MKKIILFGLFVTTLAIISSCSSGAFTIEDENFHATDVCDAEGTYEIFMEIGGIRAKAQVDIQVHMLLDGIPSLWCHGLIHQFVGTVNIFGYTFESDENEPMQFKVDRKKGYYYVAGRGTITDPEGRVTVLP